MNETLKGLSDTEIIALYQKIHDNEPMELTGKYPSPKRHVNNEKTKNEISVTETRQDNQQNQISNR